MDPVQMFRRQTWPVGLSLTLCQTDTHEYALRVPQGLSCEVLAQVADAFRTMQDDMQTHGHRLYLQAQN